MQAVTYNEFLPALGVTLMPYGGYDSSVNVSIASEFSTAAFRMGHSQTNNLQLRLNEDGTVIPQGHLPLADMFFDPSLITDECGIEPILRGLAVSVQEAHDVQIVEGLRSLLFGTLDPSGLIANGTDLGALVVLRARDFGVADYNTVREAYGLEAKADFASVTDDVAIQTTLAGLYSDIDNMDLFVGILAEPLLDGTSLGETGLAIIAEQFERLRDGDRFYFENDTDLLAWLAPDDGSEATDALNWIQGLSLAKVIKLNSSVESIQDNVFIVPEPGPAVMLLVAFASRALKRGHAT